MPPGHDVLRTHNNSHNIVATGIGLPRLFRWKQWSVQVRWHWYMRPICGYFYADVSRRFHTMWFNINEDHDVHNKHADYDNSNIRSIQRSGCVPGLWRWYERSLPLFW